MFVLYYYVDNPEVYMKRKIMKEVAEEFLEDLFSFK
jgi:hypothetical protein